MPGYFQEIFNVSFLHDYYYNGMCSDLKVHLPDETKSLLELYQLRFVRDERTAGHSFCVMMKGEDNGSGFVPQKAPSETFEMVFLLELKKEQLASYTNLPERAANEALYFYNRDSKNVAPNLLFDDSSRDGSTNKLIYQTIFTYGKAFKHSFIGASAGSLTVTLKRGNSVVQSYLVSSGTDNFTVHVDASNLPSGHYTLDTGTETIPLYLLDEAPKKPVFALVEIEHSLEAENEKPFKYDNPTAYRIQLERLDRHWRYYVIAKQSMGNLTIDPITTASTPYPSSIAFTKVNSYSTAEAGTISNLEEVYGTFQSIVLFKSDVPLPAYQGNLQGIRLMNGSTAVMKNLPNPSPGSKNAEQVVCIAPSVTFPIDPSLDSADLYGTFPSKGSKESGGETVTSELEGGALTSTGTVDEKGNSGKNK